jgi:hypothetical protein
MSDVQPSAFGCVFCPFEDNPQAVRIHLIDEHAAEIAGQHWASHIHRIGEETDERV